MLEFLDVSFNIFKVISPNYFNAAKNLKVLLLQKNKIEIIKVEKPYWSIPLTEVDLSYNNINDLDRNSFFGMNNVTKLTLSRQ